MNRGTVSKPLTLNSKQPPNMKVNWKQVLKIVITVLTALAGALGVASCTKEEAPSNSPRGEDSIIAANIMHCQYENALISRDV
jgi:hypothetical protein